MSITCKEKVITRSEHLASLAVWTRLSFRDLHEPRLHRRGIKGLWVGLLKKVVKRLYSAQNVQSIKLGPLVTKSNNYSSIETQNLPGCIAVFLTEFRPTFQTTCCHHHRPDDVGSTYLWKSVCIQLRTRQYNPEDSELHTVRSEILKSHVLQLTDFIKKFISAFH
jgi:hypothetical protein